MQVILNEQGYVRSYALVGKFSASAITVDEPENLSDFEDNYRSYYLSDGVLVKSNDKQLELDNARELRDLRTQREKVCFPYVNRGYLWHNKLTDLQKKELDDWYQAWLDVTETKTVPEMPTWLV